MMKKKYYLYAMRVDHVDGQVNHYNEVTDNLVDTLKDTLHVKGAPYETMVMCIEISRAKFERLKNLYADE